MIIKDDIIFGLTPEEVEDRIKKGQVNKKENRKTKSYKEIFFNNLFSVFNLVILIMALLVLPTIKRIGDLSNIVFVFIALLNLLIGIIQEIKAKRIVDKLVLVNSEKVKVLRNLSTELIQNEEIVLDDILILEANKQIPADSLVLDGEIYVNESNITGESDDILKKKGDSLYSGSFVVSGECNAKVIHVGKDNFIEQLSSQATKYSKPNSEIMNSLNKIITIISISLIPLSILLYFVYRGYSNYISEDFVVLNLTRELVLGLVSAINGMIPYGLFLLTSVSLAASIIKLAKSKTVVQELYCIEQLARVDVLCLDKTGTITDGTMKVEELILVDPKYQALEIISSMNGTLKGTNQTSKALKDRFGDSIYFSATSILNFNSTNKFSAVTFKEVGTFALGAPDILVKLKKNDPYLKLMNSRALSGNRVLALCKTPSKIKDNKLAGPFELVALISIHDNIREGAKETIKEFIDNGVQIKIISGDNPMTVSAIARDAGVPNYDKWISLDGLTDEEVVEAANEYAVFGRVKPKQKKLLVQALKKEGHKVAMTGDGVNDILALRESDCSIAMASGSEAVKTVAHLVLLDSNFLSLPKVVNEGRRVINNIERSASLFLSKTFLMILINITAIVLFFMNPSLEFTSPFRQPSQLMIIETFIIGISSLILALEPNAQIISGKFLTNIFKGAVPGAIIVFIDLLLVRFLSPIFGFSDLVESNISLLTSTYAFFMVLIYISIPYSKLRMWVSIITAVLISLCPLISIYTLETFGADFFHYGFIGNVFQMEPAGYLMTVSLILGSALLYALFLFLKINKIRSVKK